jgi:transposase
LKSGVTKPHRYEPDVNATYQDMARHYATAVIPARPYKPRDKAKVEAGVQFAERWIIARLRRTRFTSLGALNDAILELVAVINDRPFKKLEGTRRSLFEEIDKPALIPLPLARYEFATWRQARVNIDYHLEIDHHYYSVPYTLAREVVDVRVTNTTVEVFVKNRRVAAHARSYDKGRHVTDAAHMPAAHRRYLEWTPGRILAWANKTGPATGAFISELLTRRPHPEQGFRSALGVLRLAKRYGDARLEAACARASACQSFSYKSVESILKHNLDQQPLGERAPRRSHAVHPNVRGPNYYQ